MTARRSVLLLAVPALAASVGAVLWRFGPAPPAAAAVQPAAKPNVVVLMTDDQTVESVRVMANVRRLLAAQGTTFANSFVSFSLCCPSRATLVTGQYGHNHTVMGNQPPEGGYQKLRPTHANTLPAWLQAAGYRTVHIGKYLNGYGREDPREVPPGWTEWYGSVDPSTYRFYDYTLNENGTLRTYGSRAEDYQADVYAAKAVDAVRRLAPQAQPFFLSVAFLAPHSGGPREPDDPRNQATPVPAPRHRDRFAAEPLPAPPSLNEADVSDKPAAIQRRPLLGPQRVAAVTENYRQRLESLLAVDEAIGRVVAALEAAGELERTLIVFTSDNGFFHGEHRVPAGKVLVYEPSTRVPLILRGPGVPEGRRHDDLVANVDLAATIVDAAGARPGRPLDGRSLIPLAQDAGKRLGRDVLLETGGYAAIRTPRYVYVEHSSGEQELYDLATDPHQLQSRHADPALAGVRSVLAQRLLALRRCAGAACRTPPRVGLALRYAKGKRSCARGNVAVTVRGALPGTADFRLGGSRVKLDARAPFSVVLAKRRLSPRRSTLLRARLTYADGRQLTLDRLLRRC